MYLVRPWLFSYVRLPSLYQVLDFFLLNCTISLIFSSLQVNASLKASSWMKDLFLSCFLGGCMASWKPPMVVGACGLDVLFNRSGKRDSKRSHRWAIALQPCPCDPTSDRPTVQKVSQHPKAAFSLGAQ